MTHRPRPAPLLVPFCLGLAAVLLPPPVGGRDDPPPGRQYALLVGVRTYKKDELKNLKYTENDVNDLARLLREGGYRRVVVMTQTEAARDQDLAPTAQNIRDQLKALLEDRKPEDSVLVAFSGHGLQFKGEKESYFCPADSRLSDKATLVSLAEVYRGLQECQAGMKVLVVDACRSDPQPENKGPAKMDLESVTRPQTEKAPGGVAALFSCSEGQYSYESDDLKHGIFFHYLIEGFSGKAANKRGEVTLERLASYVKDEVPDRVKDEDGPRAPSATASHRRSRRFVGAAERRVRARAGRGHDRERQATAVRRGGRRRRLSGQANPPAAPRRGRRQGALRCAHRQGTLRAGGRGRDRARLLLGSADRKGGQAATRQNILDALKWLAEKAGPDDPVFFAFFGEGAPLGDLGDHHCYLAADSTFQGRDNNAVSAAEIGDALKGLKSQQFAVFLDVNFKGFTPPTDGKPIPEPSFTDKPFAEFRGDAGFGDGQEFAPGRVLFMPDHLVTPSLDGPDHGIFAMAILDGLKGAADAEGQEADGLVTVNELSEYLVKQVSELARKYGATDKDKGQGAMSRWGPNSHFVLSHNPKPYQEAKERLAKFERLVKDGEVSAEIAAEGRQYLARMPKLESQRELRKDYQKLADGDMTPADFVTARDKTLEGTKLARSVAEKFAGKVIDATKVVQSDYYKEENQGELTVQAVRKLYRFLEERMPDPLEARLQKAKDLSEDQLKELLIDARTALGNREDLDKDKDVDVALVEMLRTLDPYTTYIGPEAKLHSDASVQGNFSGIGVTIRKDAATDMLRVVTPIKGGPAYKAGLLTGDVITKITRAVDGEGKPLPQAEETPTRGLTVSDAVKKLLGKEGAKVKLTVQREGAAKPLEFEITRGRVEVETVFGVKRKANDDWDFMLDDENKIGYLRLSQFTANSYRDVAAAMEDLKKQGIKGFVLDLRFNPGGLLKSTVTISDLFIDDGMIVSIRPRGKPEAIIRGKHDGSLLDFPMVCLVNGVQRQRQRDRLRLPARPAPGHHHGLAQLRQGQRPDLPQVRRRPAEADDGRRSGGPAARTSTSTTPKPLRATSGASSPTRWSR